jgi:energy-coupling factor transport system ATP-binding protein
VISLKNGAFRYEGAANFAFSGANVEYSAGEFALIAGATGSGKSTFLRTLNGLAPHFTGGIFQGSVGIDGMDLTGREPHDFAHLVGYVNQLAEASFVADTVREELAFGMEQLGIDSATMVARISKVAESLGLVDVLDSPLDTLSGGYQQRVAIAAALSAGQQILLLDEPTSELDESSANSLFQLLETVAHRNGITVLIAEHRVDRLLPRVDSLTIVESGLVTKYSNGPDFNAHAQAAGLLPQVEPTSALPAAASKERLALQATDLSVWYGKNPALEGVNLRLCAGSITGIFGTNGSGKSSLLWALQGTQDHGGTVQIFTDAPSEDRRVGKVKAKLRQVTLVPQSSSDLLMLHTVAAELTEAERVAGLAPGTTVEAFERLVGKLELSLHPRDLSSGQQLALALALQLGKGSPVLLLDEPTRGLDYLARRALAGLLEHLAATGHAILIASHDREFLKSTTQTCIRLDAGRIAAAGPSDVVLA